MNKTIAVINQKGGVGKSTTALHIAHGLSLRGFRVLAIDMDPQRNLSYMIGADLNASTILEVLRGSARISDIVQPCSGYYAIPSHKGLSGADAFITGSGKEYRLRNALEGLRGSYDYVVIDTSPMLGILTVNALAACDAAIIPAQADILSLQSIADLAETIDAVRKHCNEALSIDGILLTRYSSRSVLARELTAAAEALAAKLGTRLYASRIREAVAIKEAQLNQQSVFSYAPASKVAQDYDALIYEIIGR